MESAETVIPPNASNEYLFTARQLRVAQFVRETRDKGMNWADARPYLPASSAPSFLFQHRRGDALHSALTSIAPSPAQVLNVANLYTYDTLVVD